MAVGFGTPVSVNCVNGRTSFGIALSGVTSGQPIIVMVAGNGTVASGYTLSDNFSTPYTWTLVVNSVNGGTNICGVAFIGTGGAGTSGTVTVSGISTSNYIGGVGVSLTGASTASGLSAVDVTNTASGSSTSASVSVTPSASNEGALCFVSTVNAVSTGMTSPWVNTAEYLPVSSINIGYLSTYPSPTSGSALTATWSESPSWGWATGGLVVKAAGAVSYVAPPIHLTPQAVNRASRY